MTTPIVPGTSPASVLAAALTTGTGPLTQGLFSTTNFPSLPSLVTEGVWLPADATFNCNFIINGTLQSLGWATGNVTTVTAAYTALPTDAVILANATGGAFTVTLPDATGPGFFTGQRYTVIKTDSSANDVTVTGTNGQTINGAASVVLGAQYTGISVVFDGVGEWWATAGAATGAQDYLGVFGDGTDGAVVLDGSTTYNSWSSLAGSTYTMTRDVFAQSLTVNSGVTLAPSGFRIFCQGALANAGTISVAGNAGLANGTAGSGTSNGSLGKGQAGGAGNTGAGSGGTAVNGAGTNTGGGGGAGSGGAGGSGGANGVSASFYYKVPQIALTGIGQIAGTSTNISGGPGGGGGGGDGTNHGGGGGGGGGSMVIFAWSAVNTGTITAAGGAGGTPTAGNTGGGGGGSGGVILVYTLSPWTAGTTSVAGGSGGSLHGTGSANGSTGGAGTVLNQVLE